MHAVRRAHFAEVTFSSTGTIYLGANMTTSGNSLVFPVSVVRNGTAASVLTTGGSAITFSGTLDGDADNTRSLTLVAGGGSIIFTGAVGASHPLNLLTISSANNVTASAAVFQTGNVAVGSLVKIYQTLFPNTDYMIASVVNVVSNTVITLDQQVSNAGVIGAGLGIDLIKNPQQAFRNILNSNVARYYATSTGAYFDTFNAFAVKVVFQSNNMAVIPYVSSLRAIAVSA